MNMKQEVIKLEQDMIRKALPACNYDLRSTARSLGLSFQGLLNKIRRYQIPVAKIVNKPMCPTCGRLWRMSKRKP